MKLIVSFNFLFNSLVINFHPKTWNVWTHIISSLIYVYLLYISQSWILVDNYLDILFINLFGVASIVLFMISSAYHLFSCKSEEAMCLFARLDFSGISIGIICSLLPGIYYALNCFPLLKWINIAIVLAFSIISTCLFVIPKLTRPEYKTRK